MPTQPDPNEHLSLTLTKEEIGVLRQGLLQWGGPAPGADGLAVTMGFEDRLDLYRQATRIAEALSTGEPLTRLDWTRALVSTEVNFASDVLGAGYEWNIVTGFDDLTTLRLLRGLQSKLMAVRVALPSG